MRKFLSISNQTFSNIREDDSTIYVDKTEQIHKLVTHGKRQKIFFSRPRRFGKSLLCSTFKSLFKGEKQFFKGLYIEDKWDWAKKYPVIHIMFGTQSGEIWGRGFFTNTVEKLSAEISLRTKENIFDLN